MRVEGGVRAGLLTLLSAVWSSLGLELTFELPDNQEQCFFEDIKKDTDSTIEFQVVTGGQYDVDMQLTGPNGQVLYKDVRKQYDSFTWKTDTTGAYQVCFSNEFSTFSHKIVYMDWQIGDDKPLIPNMETHLSAMTMLESSAVAVHEKLKVVDDYQTHHRLREATGRKRAEDLNERVLWWSVGQTTVIFLCGIGQVAIFSDGEEEERFRSIRTLFSPNFLQSVFADWYCVGKCAVVAGIGAPIILQRQNP